MSYINTQYSKYYNEKYHKCGHVFQKRYTSSIIKSDNYILETSRYIHLNPVKARMVNKPSKYKWRTFADLECSRKIRQKDIEGALAARDLESVESKLHVVV